LNVAALTELTEAADPVFVRLVCGLRQGVVLEAASLGIKIVETSYGGSSDRCRRFWGKDNTEGRGKKVPSRRESWR
jgi:hypothetical protein